MRHSLLLLAFVLAGCGEDDLGVAGGSGGSSSGGGSGGSAGDAAASGGSTSSGGSGGAGDSGLGGGAGQGPPSLKRIGDTLDAPSLAESNPKRFVDIAHHGTKDAYLVVTGSSAISAVMLDGDGNALGAPVSLAETSAWTQGPRVTRGAGKFLVAWHDNRQNPNQAELRGRMVSFDGQKAVPEAHDFPIGPPPTRAEAPPGMAWSETSKRFLVAWQSVPSTDLRARLMDASGTLIGQEIVLTSDPDWQSDPAIAWNSASDEFLVVWDHADTTGAIRARRVKASDGALVGPEIPLGPGTHIPAVAYDPGKNQFVAAWWGSGVHARVLGADGNPLGPALDLMAGYGSYDGFAMARHSSLGTFAAVLHGATSEDFAAAFSADGSESSVIQATQSPNSIGNFNPRVAENPLRKEWMMVTSRGFATLAVQRLGP